MTSPYWLGRQGRCRRSATDQIKLTFSPELFTIILQCLCVFRPCLSVFTYLSGQFQAALFDPSGAERIKLSLRRLGAHGQAVLSSINGSDADARFMCQVFLAEVELIANLFHQRVIIFLFRRHRLILAPALFIIIANAITFGNQNQEKNRLVFEARRTGCFSQTYSECGIALVRAWHIPTIPRYRDQLRFHSVPVCFSRFQPMVILFGKYLFFSVSD